MAVTINEGTQTDILTTLVGGTETGIVRLDVGTGTTASNWGGSVTVSTINNGTVTRVGNLGTLELGSVVVNAGANNIGDVDIATGTVTRVSNIGTLELGSVALTSSNGTVIRVGNIGTLELGSVILNASTNNIGDVDIATGTVTRLSNVGTLESGTVRVNHVPPVIGTSYGTLGTTGAAVWGTIIAASGAGTRQYVSGVSIVVASGTVDCAITNVGTVAAANGAGILARGQFTPGGGIAQTFVPVEASGTNGTLAFWMGGAGTAYFRVSYWQGV